jgi:hypothetical protein
MDDFFSPHDRFLVARFISGERCPTESLNGCFRSAETDVGKLFGRKKLDFLRRRRFGSPRLRAQCCDFCA